MEHKDTPTGMSIFIVCFKRTFPAPPHDLHSPPLGIVVPSPPHCLHVLAIWNPLSRTKVRDPVPLQPEHVDRSIPGFNPVAEHEEQSSMGEMVTFFFVPLQASRKLTDIEAWMSSPWNWRERELPAPEKELKSCSKNSPGPCRPFVCPANPPKPGNPPPNPDANALGSKPGACDAAPYLS